MIFFTIGSPSSASTWVFNAVRKIAALSEGGACSIYSETSAELLNSPVEAGQNIVVKAHSVDSNLLNLLNVSNAKVIISTRDPRDSCLSMRERFGHATKDIAVHMGSSFASIGMIRKKLTIFNSNTKADFSTGFRQY